jgi:hypothetical protein
MADAYAHKAANFTLLSSLHQLSTTTTLSVTINGTPLLGGCEFTILLLLFHDEK